MSTTWYAKIDCNFHSNRKAVKAGLLGRAVYVLVLCMNAQRGAHGTVPASDLETWYIARELGVSEDDARRGIDDAIDAGLIEIIDHVVLICGWTDGYAKYPMSNAERQERFRNKNKPTKASNDADANVSDATNSNGSNGAIVTRPLSVTTSNVGRKEGREGGNSEPPAFDPADPMQRGNLARQTWTRLSEIRIGIAKELGMSGILPLTAITPASANQSGYRNLMARIQDEGTNAPDVCTRVLEVLTAQARKTRSIEWLSEKAFTEGAWRHAREAVPEWRGKPTAQQPTERQVFINELGDEASA